MILLNIDCNEKIGVGVVDYNAEEGNLSFRPHLNSDIALLMSYINIGFDSDSMIANQVWGFTPKASWNFYVDKEEYWISQNNEGYYLTRVKDSYTQSFETSDALFDKGTIDGKTLEQAWHQIKKYV